MRYRVTKRFGHEVGLSCSFRQWKARSHCNQIHGYALAIELIFEATTLDNRNWVIDFGAFKDLKETIHNMFDHTTVLDKHDPLLEDFKQIGTKGGMTVRVMDGVGCEKFAEWVFRQTEAWLLMQDSRAVKIVEVKVSEHAGNSASYLGE